MNMHALSTTEPPTPASRSASTRAPSTFHHAGELLDVGCTDPSTRTIYEASRGALSAALRDARNEAMAPSPRLTIPEWTERHFRLSRESSAEPGEVRLYGFQKGPLEAMGDPALWGVAVMKSARIGYTMSLKAAAGYYLEHDPSPVLVVMPVEDDAKDFVKTEIEPMMRETPVLAAIAGGGSIDEWHTKFTQRGSVLRVRMAYKADAFRRLTTRINIADEIDADAWDNGQAKSQGDKIRLLRKRGETFWNSKLIVGSTPTRKGFSRIEKWFLRGDQRRYFVPCPHCGEFQTLQWGGRSDPHGVKWPAGRPWDAYYVCEANGCVIEEREKVWMDAHGEWRATNFDDDGNPLGEPGLATFHLNTLYSLFPAAGWGKLATEFVDAAKQPAGVDRQGALQSFWNTVLGETWDEDDARSVTTHELMNRLEDYGAAPVPPGVRFLTAFVDVQAAEGGRFEISIYGWGIGYERWLVGHWVLSDHPLADPRAWLSLEALLRRPFRSIDVNGSPRDHYVQGAGIDAGDGNSFYAEILAFTTKHAARQWVATKGYSNPKGERRKEGLLPKVPTLVSGGHKLWIVDADAAKDQLWRHLAAEPGPGAFHFPTHPITGAVPMDATFFKSLAECEKPRAAPGRPGRTYWHQKPGNEAFDCAVGAYVQALRLVSLPGPFARMVAIPAAAATPALSDAKPTLSSAVKSAAPVQAPTPAPAPRQMAKPKQKVITSPFMRRR